MGIEIERKFLVRDDRWRGLAPGIPYRQGYLHADGERAVRVRTAMALNTRMERVHCRPWGLSGGLEGMGNEVALRIGGKTVNCPIYQREKLDVGHKIVGPAVIEQFDCTSVIEAGQTAEVDPFKNLIVR